MAWIIASVPFWIIGLGCFSIAVLGTMVALRNDKTGEEVKTTLIGFLVWLAAAGIVLSLAARVSGL